MYRLFAVSFAAALLPSAHAASSQSTMTAPIITSITTETVSPLSSPSSTATATADGASTTTRVPDVQLSVPELSVDKIALDVDNLEADINLAAQIAGIVELNAGIQVHATRVNLTIADVQAELELDIRLGSLVEIVNRTLETLELNPDLVDTLNSQAASAAATATAIATAL